MRDVVRKQAELGIDVVNDGEYSKRSGFSSYLKERLGGWEERDASDDDALRNVTARDRLELPGVLRQRPGRLLAPRPTPLRDRAAALYRA